MFKKLRDLVSMENGNVFPKDTSLNDGELKKELCYLYSPAVFEYDRHLGGDAKGDKRYIEFPQKFISVLTGDIVISPVTQLATIVRNHGTPLLLSPNYVKVLPDEEKLDRAYFVFWFNELFESRKQIFEMKQGTTVIKLSTNSLKELTISLPNLTQQKLIGTGYINSLMLVEQLKRKQKLQVALLKGINQQLIEGEKL